MPLTGIGMQHIGVVPGQLLRGRRLAISVRTTKASGANAQVDWSPQNGHMAQQSGAIRAVLPGQGCTTAAAAGAGTRTFCGQNEFVGPRDLGMEDAHIGISSRISDVV